VKGNLTRIVLQCYNVSDRDAGDVSVRSQMDADAHSAATGAGKTTATVSGARWWGPAASTASASTDVVSLLS
jgi:hypothetical protein